MENIPSQYNTRVMCALLFRNLKLLTFEYCPKYDLLSKHLRSPTHQIQMPLFWIRILEPLFCSVYVINISRATCIKFQEQGFMQCFSLFGRSGTTRLEGPEDGRDEDDGDDGGGQDVAQQKHLPVLRAGGIHRDDFFDGPNTQF